MNFAEFSQIFPGEHGENGLIFHHEFSRWPRLEAEKNTLAKGLRELQRLGARGVMNVNGCVSL